MLWTFKPICTYQGILLCSCYYYNIINISIDLLLQSYYLHYVHDFNFIDKPTVSVQSLVIQLEHTSFNLMCTANIDPNSPNNLTSLVWSSKNGSILASYSNKLAVLNFTNALRSMSGEYECIVSDGTYNYSATTSLYIQCE